jgi:RNA polymerase sigma-70 factor (ECF subfamily)
MNEQQFREQILPLSQRLFGLSLRITGNRDEAKDVLQDVFLKLWTTRETLHEIKNIAAFATTIIRNQSLDRLRLRKPTIDIDIAGHRIEQEIDPTDNDNAEKLALISRTLKHLSEIQQKVFTMRDIECLEFEQIANETGMTEENVRVTLSRARKRIRELIEERQKVVTCRN